MGACYVTSVVSDSLRPHGPSVHGILQARILEWVTSTSSLTKHLAWALDHEAGSPEHLFLAVTCGLGASPFNTELIFYSALMQQLFILSRSGWQTVT